MLRTFIIIGIIVIVASTVIGSVLGLAGAVVWFLVKVALLGAAVYLALRIISPRTAARLRERIERRSLPPL